VRGALEYFEWIGETFEGKYAEKTVYGLTKLNRLGERVPTVAFRMEG
jgi:hypothetical protein